MKATTQPRLIDEVFSLCKYLIGAELVPTPLKGIQPMKEFKGLWRMYFWFFILLICLIVCAISFSISVTFLFVDGFGLTSWIFMGLAGVFYFFGYYANKKSQKINRDFTEYVLNGPAEGSGKN